MYSSGQVWIRFFLQLLSRPTANVLYNYNEIKESQLFLLH